MFTKPRIGFPAMVVAVLSAYVILLIVRTVGQVAVPMWALPVAVALTAAACYVGASLGTAAREKAASISE